MPSFCAVQSCDDKYGHAEHISFHKFPFKRQELLKRWLEFTQRGPDWQPSRWSSICSRHFRDEDFTCSTDRKILKKTAVPSVQVKQNIKNSESASGVHKENNVSDITKQNDVKKTEMKSNTAEGCAIRREEVLTDNYDATEEKELRPLDTQSNPTPKIKCRLCGNVCSSAVSFSTNFEIYGMIQKCFPTLNIQKDDHLPKEMCRFCLKRLESFSRFIDKVVETQSELQRKYRPEKANNNVRVAERQLKVKQEPVVRVKQEVAESFLTDDLDMAVDESCEQDPDAEANVEQKYDFCDFPVLNAQDIINNCDIMEIINLDDPFIDIPDDDANTNCENGVQQQEQQQQQQQQQQQEQQQRTDRQRPKRDLPSAHELLQEHLLSEEHNYAYAPEDMKEEWQLKNSYKTEKTEGGGEHEKGSVFISNVDHEEEEQVVYTGEEHQTQENDEQTDIAYKDTNYPSNDVDANKLPAASTTTSTSMSTALDTRSVKPIVTSVSELADASLAGRRDIRAGKLMVTAVNNLPSTNTAPAVTSTERSTPSTEHSMMKTHAKPNIVVLNESIVKSSTVFQLHTCQYCHIKFFSSESLNQHYMIAHQHSQGHGEEHVMQGRQEGHKPQGEQVQQQQQQQQLQQQQQQQLHLQNAYNQTQDSMLTLNHNYQGQMHQQSQDQLPMVSLPSQYRWKPYGVSTANAPESFNLNCKIEKGYSSPLTQTADSGGYKAEDNFAYQQTNIFGDRIFYADTNTAIDTLTQNNASQAKDTPAIGAPNAVRILEMKRTFLRHHESYNSGIINTSCEYDKMPSNGFGGGLVKSDSFRSANESRWDEENQLRAEALSAPMPTSTPVLMPRLQKLECQRSPRKQRTKMNKKIIARLKALERKLNSSAAPNIILAEYRQLRRLYTTLQMKYKRLETQINGKKRVQAATAPNAKQPLKAKPKPRFFCPICRRTQFKSIYQLLHHKRANAHWTRSQRYRKPKHFAATCCGCEKFFRHKTALRNHMRYICQGLPLSWFKFQMQTFKCRYCRRSTFNHWRLYRRHEVKCKKLKEQRLKYQANVRQRERAKISKKCTIGKTPHVNCSPRQSAVITASMRTKTFNGLPTSQPSPPKYKQPVTSPRREYICAICTKVFPSSNSLHQHNITHSDQRRHKCHLCERTFKRRNGLTQHVRGFHLQLKPHQCAVCQRTYALKSDALRCRHAKIKRITNNNALAGKIDGRGGKD